MLNKTKINMNKIKGPEAPAGVVEGQAELTLPDPLCYLPPLAAGRIAASIQARSSAWLERYVDIVEVSGSSPLGPTRYLTTKPTSEGVHAFETGREQALSSAG